MSSKAELIDQVKAVQRSGPEAKAAYWAYCDENLGGGRDPSRHDENTLGAFLEAWNAGQLEAPSQQYQQAALQPRSIVSGLLGRPAPQHMGHMATPMAQGEPGLA